MSWTPNNPLILSQKPIIRLTGQLKVITKTKDKYKSVNLINVIHSNHQRKACTVIAFKARYVFQRRVAFKANRKKHYENDQLKYFIKWPFYKMLYCKIDYLHASYICCHYRKIIFPNLHICLSGGQQLDQSGGLGNSNLDIGRSILTCILLW